MKLVIKNSSLIFEKSNIVAVHEVFGNDVEGMILNSYLQADGSTQLVVTSQNYAVSPFIDIDGFVGNIDIEQLFSGYTSKVLVAFYSNDTEASFISAILREEGQEQGIASLQVLSEDIPATAKYLRFCPRFGTSYDSTYEFASSISFYRSV